jgi:hypothetical protein
MPSHVTHLLYAEDILARCMHAGRLHTLALPPNRSYLVLGAQGPDVFYHNQRRRPTALAYGSLMHRRRYGTAVAHMWEWARAHDLTMDSWAAAWLVGFASHAILDRYTHPFINAHAGWPESGKPETERFRSMHPFLERIIDVQLLKDHRQLHPNDLDFYRQVSCGEEPPRNWIALMTHALGQTYDKAAADALLDERLRSAYLDTMGYYRFTNRVDADYLREALEKEERGELDSRWLSIVHPPEVPGDVDVLNRAHHEWPHPCSLAETSNESFLDCYERAVRVGSETVDRIVEAWTLGYERGLAEIENAVTDWNLSDGRPTERPCPKRHAVPLPLAELQKRIRASIREGRAQRRR